MSVTIEVAGAQNGGHSVPARTDLLGCEPSAGAVARVEPQPTARVSGQDVRVSVTVEVARNANRYRNRAGHSGGAQGRFCRRDEAGLSARDADGQSRTNVSGSRCVICAGRPCEINTVALPLVSQCNWGWSPHARTGCQGLPDNSGTGHGRYRGCCERRSCQHCCCPGAGLRL